MKITKEMLRKSFERLVKAMNKNIDGGSYNGLVLDYYPIGGGYKIVEYDPVNGESDVFGSTRRSAREMYLSMEMTAQALKDIRYRQELLNKYEVV